MKKRWRKPLVVVFLFVASFAFGAGEYEFVFSQIDLGGAKNASSDYQIVDTISLTQIKPGMMQTGDYSIAPVESAQPAIASGTQLWIFY